MPNRRKILAWIYWEHDFGVVSLNTDMTQDHSPPPSCTSTGFISLLFPPIQRPISSEFSLAPIVATRSQRRAVQAYWDLLRRLLSAHGHLASLDRIACDPDEGWRIHFLATDPGPVAAMHLSPHSDFRLVVGTRIDGIFLE
jgi:hypothetical protein